MNADKPLTIIYDQVGGVGWDPVTVMVELAARLFDARLIARTDPRDYGRRVKARGLLPRSHRGGQCLVIAPQPGQLNAILAEPGWWRGYDQVVAWVIDSFWDDRIPRIARRRGAFDHLFVTDGELVDRWADVTGTPTSFLPFGSDALSAVAPSDRPVDLQRLGRQPLAWDDDADLAARAAAAGLVYRGRLSFLDDPGANQRQIWDAQASAKYLLAFTNVVSPAAYTHPTRHYLTARWTDALAYGASVAGIAPACQATRELLWDGALLELETLDVTEGLSRIRGAVERWTPQIAARNHHQALRRLDWRWRFAEIRAVLERAAPRLDAELADLRGRIAATADAGIG